MAKITLTDAINQALAEGAVAVPTNSFLDKDGNPVKVRSMESTYDPLVEGDEFTIPNDYKVLRVKFDKESTDDYPCIYCMVKSLDGSERAFRFFPNSLCKNINPVVDGHRLPKVKTTGSASDLYRTADSVDEGLALLKGKTIVVTKSVLYPFKDRSSSTIRDTHIYQYDLKN